VLIGAAPLVQGKRDRKKVSYHNAGGGEMDGSEYEASSSDEETEDEGEEMEPVRDGTYHVEVEVRVGLQSLFRATSMWAEPLSFVPRPELSTCKLYLLGLASGLALAVPALSARDSVSTLDNAEMQILHRRTRMVRRRRSENGRLRSLPGRRSRRHPPRVLR